MEKPADDGGEGQLPFPAVPTVEDPVEFQFPGHAECSPDMAVGKGSRDGQEFGRVPDGGSSLEEDVQTLDDQCRETGEVGDGLLAYPASVPPGFPDENVGGLGRSGGNRLTKEMVMARMWPTPFLGGRR